MVEIVWRYDSQQLEQPTSATTAADAKLRLDKGNQAFVEAASDSNSSARTIVHLSADDLGLGAEPGHAPRQMPFAAVLGCADARVPAEFVFGQAANNLFVVRVAGNIVGDACLGSLQYAVDNLASLRQVVVVGHTSCGAAAAAVSSYLNPGGYLGVAALPALRIIVDSLLASVRTADLALRQVVGDSVSHRVGFEFAVADLAVCLNAALSAHLLRRWFADRQGPNLGVSYGVYNLATRQVGLPITAGDAVWAAGLDPAPATDAEFRQLAQAWSQSQWIDRVLG
jgi:carbonic anhydrase